MAPRKKAMLSKEDYAKKKSEQAKRRLERIKNDPVLLAEYKEKERQKYLKKKEKGQRKCVKDMTPREHRKARKQWVAYSSDYRKKLKICGNTDKYMENTPPPSDEEIIPEASLINNERRDEARRRSTVQRKKRNSMLKKKDLVIENLKKKLACEQQTNRRLKRRMIRKQKALTPRSKIVEMANDPNQKAELIKKALFGEIIQTQLVDKKIETPQKKTCLKTILSSPLTRKYKIWRLGKKAITYKKMGFNRTKYIAKRNRKRIEEIIHRFYEDDSNSRCAAGKKECITRKKVKKQKRYLLDSLRSLHHKFLKSSVITIAYAQFCKLRPFWVVVPKLTDRDTCACVTHENINLKLDALKHANVLDFATYQTALETICCDRYSEKCLARTCKHCSTKILPYKEFDNSKDIAVKQWKHGKELIKDIKTKQDRYVTKYKKEIYNIKPRVLVMQLEETDLPKLFQHEQNIVHQYKTIKSLKDSLTEKDAIIHMDFSENYTTKCNQEIQSYHFGGSRTQISLHTVVVYTKDKVTSHCTVSLNLSHNAGAIWAHLQPVLLRLPSSVENLHFLSDGPVTQYRNKTMFYILGCRIQDFYPVAMKYTWNFHEAGHGKGAPDGIGATCKRSADQLIAQKGDITNLYEFVATLRERCPNIQISVIEDVDIERVNKIIKEDEKEQKPFKGTLLVHQVSGDIYNPKKLVMKSLSCFCNDVGCNHYNLGTISYQSNANRLHVSDIFTDSEDDIPLASMSHIAPEKSHSEDANDIDMPLASMSHIAQEKSKTSYSSGDYVLIKLIMGRKEYRYAAICSKYDDEDGELTVTFLKVCNEDGTEFKINENDIADVPYGDVIGKLPVPNIIVKRNTVIKSSLDFIKTQLCTLAVSLTLFNSVRLPREAFRYGTLPYLVVYTAWLILAALPASLLQLAVGQLSQQDPVGVWRAVPILRGVGHLKVITSYICSIYTMMYVALSAAYLIWIGKGSFPLKDCTKLQMTPHGYENKMNASECFNSTFLAPFTMYPQYLGIMAIIIFILWFFVPILLYRLRKSLKVSLSILGPITLIIAIVLCIFLSNGDVLFSMLEDCEQWKTLSQPFIWHSAMVQALLSTQVAGGYLISAGGTVYRHSDVRWTSIMIIIVNLITGWLWVFLWNSIGGEGTKDTSFVSILVVIYQSSVTERRSKEWPLLAFGIVVLSGIITVLLLLFPIFSKLCRMFNDNWRLTAAASSAVGTALTITVLLKGLKVATVLDELVVPVLAAFTTAVEIVGFVFIYGWYYLRFDLEFLTGTKLPWIWIAAWSLTPLLLVGVSGWWLRALLKATWNQTTLWPLGGVLVGILVVLVIAAAIAVAKEEQFNLITKIASSFRSSRLWGPEEPMARYVWMSQRISTERTSETNFPQITQKTNEIYADNWIKPIDTYEKNINIKNGCVPKEDVVYKDKGAIYTKHSISRSKKIKKGEEKFRSPNICIAKTELGGPLVCNCNRHFTLNVPDLRKAEITTSL